MLETTAGQGTAIGYRFEQLQKIIDLVEQKERMTVCIDTAHVFAAGYDIKDPKNFKKVIKEFDDIIGLDIVPFLISYQTESRLVSLIPALNNTVQPRISESKGVISVIFGDTVSIVRLID